MFSKVFRTYSTEFRAHFMVLGALFGFWGGSGLSVQDSCGPWIEFPELGTN